MLKVNSKKTINKLVNSNLKKYKMRNLFTIITIILSVSLISVFAFMESAIDESNRKDFAKRQHVIYHEVTENQIDQISNNPQISAAKEFKKGQSFEVDDYILVPYYLEASSSPILSLDIIQGNYPQKVNEILVYDEMLIKMGIEPNVGQSVPITYLDGTTEEYVVSGILKAETTDVFTLYFSKEYALNGSQLKNVPFHLAAQIVGAEKMGSEEFLSTIRDLGASTQVERKNINENNAFVNSLSYSSQQIMMTVLISIAILMVSVLVIYSIFYISISDRTRQFGQLRTLGMTQKQIKRMVKKEGTIFSLSGSAIGIMIGAILVFSLKPQGFSIFNFIVYTLAIFIANYMTVQISIAKPAKLAAAVSPIEATRMSGYEVKTKSKQTKKLQRKLSPISLSIIGTKGNRKKSVMTLISLCLAGIVFMISATFINSIDREEYARQNYFSFGDFVISLSSNASKVNENGQTGIQKQEPLSNQMIQELREMKGVKEVISFQNLDVKYTYNEMTESDVSAPFSEKDITLIENYIKEGTVDYDRMVKNKEVIIVHNKTAKEIFGWDFKLGDTVTLKWYNGQEHVEDEFTIGAILTDTNKLYKNKDMFKLSYPSGWFMMPEDLLSQMMIPDFNLNSKVVVSCNDYRKDHKEVEKAMLSITESNPLIKLSTFSEQLEHSAEQYNMFYLTFMGVALFVIAFSLINLLNTLISNTMARKSEFAALSAIGASNKQIKTMILGEGLYFAAINILTTATLGTLIGLAFIKFAKWNGVGYLIYRLPFLQLIGYCLFVLLVTFGISSVITKIISKKSLVERLREVE